MTPLRPALGAPAIDHPRFAYMSFEAICLAHRRVCGSPKEVSKVSKSERSSFGQALIEIESLVGRPSVEIDKSQYSVAQQTLRRRSICWCAAQETHGFLQRSRKKDPRRSALQGIGGFAVTSHRRINLGQPKAGQILQDAKPDLKAYTPAEAGQRALEGMHQCEIG
jgi:hypothetical protein